MEPEEAISLFKWAEQQVGNAEHIDLAISALEKQIPKKPDKDDCCPICDTYCKDDCGIEGDYCPNCGQALLWED